MTNLYSHMHRKFGFCVIQWEIKNYSLLSSFHNWEVTSPTFYLRGSKVTRWRLGLRQVLRFNNKTCLFQIQRISDETPFDLVNVECKLYKYSKSVYDDWHLLKQINFKGAKYFIYEEEVNYDYFEDIKPFHFEDLLLKCELLVWFPKNSDLASRCENAAIQELSEDMLHLYESSFNFDVMLVVGENNPSVYIKAHKAILFARNPKFKKSIAANLNRNFFTFDRHNNLQACDRLLRFMYSANMENSALSPRIAVHEIASVYNVHPVVAYFTPDQLSLLSIVEMEEFEVSWVVENFFSTEMNCFNSPEIINKNFDTSLQITLYPRSLLDDSYVGLHVKVKGGWKRVIWIHFSVRNSEEEIHLKDMLGLVTDKQNFLDNTFADRRDLETFFRNESLTLIARFKVVDTIRHLKNSLNSFLEWSKDQKDVTVTSVTKCLPYSEESNYYQFFKDMSSLYESCTFRDMYFQMGGVSCNINHGILHIRCPKLYNIACQGRVIDLRIKRLGTVSRLISFLNCCNYYAPLTVYETFELYDVAAYFNLKTLQAILLTSLYRLLPTLPHRLKTKIHNFAIAKCRFERDITVKRLLSQLYL